MADGKVVDTVANQIETVADSVEEVAEATRRLNGEKLGFFFAGAGIGVAVGFGVGYFALKGRTEKKYEKVAEDEIAEMREHYRQLRIALEDGVSKRRPLEELIVEKGYAQAGGQYDEAEQRAIAEANARFPDDEGSGEEGPSGSAESRAPTGPSGSEAGDAGSAVSSEEPPSSVTVFPDEDSGPWDYAEEQKSRDPEVPYIIHIDEFRETDPPHEKITLTYYEVDDVLAGPRDDQIEDMDETIGLGNLGRWGHGSNDPNIVYVRNENMMIDFEVIRDRGSFHETVHAIRHSAVRRRPHD